VLRQIDVEPDSDRVIEVWNKIDLLDADDRVSVTARALRTREQPTGRAIAVSAVTGEGMDGLLDLFAEMIDQEEPVHANLAAGDGRALAWLYRHGRILDRTDDAEGRVSLSVRLDHQALGQFERLFPHALGGVVAQ
jgi:GTP-binding protein HflX